MPGGDDRKLPHGGAYEGFPDGPEAYREATADGTLRRLFQAAVTHAQDRIDWYDNKAGELKAPSRRIRRLSLIVFSIGTLAPIIAGALVKLADLFGRNVKEPTGWNGWDYAAHLPLAEIGYILLGIAGAAVIFDQFFDYSGSWMRFRQSQARLEVLLADLRFAWAELLAKSGGVVADRPTAAGFVALLREFVTKIEQLAEAETKDWAEQFRARVAAFDSNPNLKIRLPGADTHDPIAAAAAGRVGAGGDTGTARPTPTAGTAPSSTAQLATVQVRLAIEGTTGLDPGTLRLRLNEVPLIVPEDFMLEVPLEVGLAQRFVAEATRAGRPVGARLEIMPTPEDEGRPLALELV